ncbi:hypothetical protein GRZ55_16715 [Chelativorans sp. ZYF759]|uniref:DUF6460 domain-containing protein n=1 Tax=Chelativorans sp. ZYF759 TaxID=2692213 RepID=UPI00145E6E99|nr:DUF6460 domain-containing protein [Chelativorans sp. ZYF759]NMG40891.1 hypothetical protein [Chelativorans sp. ZYF759]
MSALNRFLGDTPLRVAIKLIVISFIVGVVMASLGLTPWGLLAAASDFFAGLWNLGFESLHRFWAYFLLGAAVVIPLFLILRIASYRK